MALGDTPLVSIVMPTYNAIDTIEEALRSLLCQTYPNLEILVVDDGSHDRSMDAAEGLHDARVKILRREHQGLVATLRSGCDRANGGCIARLDADDVAHHERIAVQVEYLQHHPDVGLLGSYAKIESSDGREWLFRPPTAEPALRHYLLWDNPFVHSSVMFRHVAYDQAGGYPEGPNEDYRLWIRIARSWKLAVLPQVLVTHRIHAASYTRVMSRAAALHGRLVGEWEAAKLLRAWPQSIPALTTTAGLLLLNRVGGRLEQTARALAGSLPAKLRGYRTRGFGDRPR